MNADVPNGPAPNLHRLLDDRTLAWNEYGDPAGAPVIYGHGSPGSRLWDALFHDLAAESGFRFVCADRLGIGHSAFLPDRRLLSYPIDISSLADGLGLDRFGVMGWSGGGAHTTACAYAIPDRLLFAGSTTSAEWPEAPQMLETAVDRVSVKLARKSPWLFGLMFGSMSAHTRRWPHSSVMRMKKATDESGWFLFDDDRFVEKFTVDQREAFAQGGGPPSWTPGFTTPIGASGSPRSGCPSTRFTAITTGWSRSRSASTSPPTHRGPPSTGSSPRATCSLPWPNTSVGSSKRRGRCSDDSVLSAPKLVPG